jgi:hypothetical protein
MRLPKPLIVIAVVSSAAVVELAGRHPQPAPSFPADQAPATAPTAGRGGGGFVPPEPIDYGNREGWTSIFDGKTLAGWDGNPEVWRVEDGAITAISTRERRVGSTHLIWQGGELADFEWKFEIKLTSDIHAGVAYRSYVDLNRQNAGRAGAAGAGGAAGGTRGGSPAGRGPARGPAAQPALAVPAQAKWTLYGPGLDYDYDLIMAGNVEDRGTPRREVAWRGLIVRDEPGKPPRALGAVGDADALKAHIRPDDWNQVHIIARGPQLTHIINGHVMTILIDEDTDYFRPSGLIGIGIEQFGFGRVSVRDVWIRR